jgi:hypothetical protein
MCRKQCCGSGSGRIRTFLVGSGRLGPDPDPGLNKWLYINFFGVCNSHNYLRNLCCLTFWSMKILFWAYFYQKNFQKKVGRKFTRVRIRIRSKIVRIRNTGRKVWDTTPFEFAGWRTAVTPPPPFLSVLTQATARGAVSPVKRAPPNTFNI